MKNVFVRSLVQFDQRRPSFEPIGGVEFHCKPWILVNSIMSIHWRVMVDFACRQQWPDKALIEIAIAVIFGKYFRIHILDLGNGRSDPRRPQRICDAQVSVEMPPIFRMSRYAERRSKHFDRKPQRLATQVL